MRPSTVIVSLIIAAAKVAGFQLPNVTGSLPVGVVTLELVDYSRIDPLAPNPEPRALMVTLFYPTSDAAVQSGNYSFARPFPLYAGLAFDSYFGVPEGTAASIVAQSYLGAPIANSDLPVLIFSHGFTASRLFHTAQLEDLASQGWIVAAVDHTYDTMFVEFRTGAFILGLSPNLTDFPGGTVGLVDVRVADVEFVANSLKNSTILEQIPGLSSSRGNGSLQMNQVGIFGHSLGGATAAQAMSNYTKFVCGANFDGTIGEPVVTRGHDKPFLQMAASDHNWTMDGSWIKFEEHSSSLYRQFEVNGTVQMSFFDLPILRDLYGDAFPPEQRGLYGTISGERVLEIETAFIDAFFGICLKGKSKEQLDSLAGGRFVEVSKLKNLGNYRRLGF